MKVWPLNMTIRQKKKKGRRKQQQQQEPKKGELINRTSWTQRYIPILIKVATMHDRCFIARGAFIVASLVNYVPATSLET